MTARRKEQLLRKLERRHLEMEAYIEKLCERGLFEAAFEVAKLTAYSYETVSILLNIKPTNK